MLIPVRELALDISPVLDAFELGPMIVVSLVGGALADRLDRRLLLAIAQLAVIGSAAALAVAAFSGNPHYARAVEALSSIAL